MKLGIVSDTHGHVEPTRKAVRMLESLEVDRVLHCGDIGSPEIIGMFAAWPTDYVFGNCDYDTDLLEQAINQTPNATCHNLFGSLELEGKRIALLHSHDRRKFIAARTSGEYDLVCYGHSHIHLIEHEENTLILNPGAIYRATPPSIAYVTLPSLEIVHVPLS